MNAFAKLLRVSTLVCASLERGWNDLRRPGAQPSACALIEMLEARQLLSVAPQPVSIDWNKVDPTLLALTQQSLQDDPRFAQLFYADLARYGIPRPPLTSGTMSASALNASLAKLHARIVRPHVLHPTKPTSRKPRIKKPQVHKPTHKPASHKPRAHKPTAHKPAIHRPATHKPGSTSLSSTSGHHVLHSIGGLNFHVTPFTSTLPVVTATNFWYDTGVLPQQLTVTFNEPVMASSWSAAVPVQDVSTGTTLALTDSNFSFTGNTLTVSLGSARIPDGDYTATLNGSLITDTSGNKLGGTDGTPGDPYYDNFFLLAGDTNHDGVVDITDYNTLESHFGTTTGMTWSDGDFNYDNKVNSADYFLQHKNYGENLSLPIPTGVVVTGVTPNSAALSWTAITDPNVTGYDVLRNGTFLATVNSASTTTYTDTGLTPNTSYTYTVESINSASQFSPPSFPGAVAVTTPPEIDLSDSGSGFIVGQSYSLTASLAGAPGDTVGTYQVSWGNGSAEQTYTASGTSATLAYDYANATGAAYTISATATTASEGTLTATWVTDLSPPSLTLSGPASGTEGATYSLPVEVSSGDSAQPYNFEIDWGAGDNPATYTSTAPITFSYNYTEPGTYTITGIVNATEGGQTGDVQAETITIAEATPTDSLTASTYAVNENTDLFLTDHFTDPGGDSLDNLTIAWGDGKTDAYNADPGTFDHVYSEAGAYAPTAIFSTEDGTYTATAAITVNEVTPTLSVYTNSGSSGGTFSLVASFQDLGSNDAPSNYTVAWGDGTSGSYAPQAEFSGTFTHTYAEPTTGDGYSATLTAVSDDGTYSATSVLAFVDTTPTFTISGFSQTTVGQPYSLDAYFTDADGDRPTYDVDWGDGSGVQNYGTTATFSHAYSGSNPFYETDEYPTITATTEDGTYLTGETLLVGGPGGAGSLSASSLSSVIEGTAASIRANFSDSAQTGLYLPGASWAIAWGDGTALDDYMDPTLSTSFSPSHDYLEPGTYKVTVGAAYMDGSDSLHSSYHYQMTTQLTQVVTEATPTLSATGDTTATVVGDTYTLVPTFTDRGQDVPQKWTLAWGDGTPAETIYGDPSSFTHVYATASTSGSTYTITATPTTEDSASLTATASVIIAQPVMTAILGDGTTMVHSDQTSMGGVYMAVNNNDDGGLYDSNGNPIPDDTQTHITYTDPDLVEVTLQSLPAAVGGNFSLTWDSTRFLVWNDAHKDNQLASGVTFDATASIPPVYLEAIAISPFMGAEVLKENWSIPKSPPRSVGTVDHILGTDLSFKGPLNVPGYSSYTYSISGPEVATSAQPAPWSATGGTVTQNSHSSATVFWNEPANGAGNGWEGNVWWHIPGHKVGHTVSVVSVNFQWPEDDPTPGIPHDNNTALDKKNELRKSVTSGNPGASALVYLSLASPTQSPNAWKRIVAGFVQHVQSYSNQGTYLFPGGRTKTLQSIYETENNVYPTLDYYVNVTNPAAQRPWYFRDPGTFFNGNAAAAPSATFNWNDTPKNGTPVGYLHQNFLANDEPFLTQMNLSETFQLDICAATIDDPNGSPQGGSNSVIYTRLATSTWAFNVNTAIKNLAPNYPWVNPNALVTVPQEWKFVTDGSRPGLNGTPANTLSDNETFKQA